MEVRLQDVQEVLWMFANEENHKKEPESELGKEVKAIYEEYLEADEFLKYCNMERERRVIEQRMMESERKGEELGFVKGEKSGFVKGEKEGVRWTRLYDGKEMIYEKYNIQELTWLDNCTLEQLNRIHKLILKDLTYEELKREVLSDIER